MLYTDECIIADIHHIAYTISLHVITFGVHLQCANTVPADYKMNKWVIALPCITSACHGGNFVHTPYGHCNRFCAGEGLYAIHDL